MLEADGPRETRRNRSLLSFQDGVPAEPVAPPPARPRAYRPPGLLDRLGRSLRGWRTSPRGRGDARRKESPAPAEPPPASRPRQPVPSDDAWRPLIDPLSVVTGVARARWLIVAATLAGAVIGVLVALATPRQYDAAAEILFDPRDLRLTERDLTEGNLPSDATLALIENQVAIIRSVTVLNQVVERLRLDEDPEFNGEGGSFLGKLLNPRALFSFGGEADGETARSMIAARNLAENLDVARSASTFVINIGVTTRDPEKSALIANATTDVYLDTAGEMRADTAGRAAGALTGRLDELRRDLETAERAVVEYKREHGIVDAQGRPITDDEIVQLNEQLATARARTAELRARAASATELDPSRMLGGTLPEQVASPVMTELLARHADLRRQADRAAAQLGPRHPGSRTIAAELEGLRQAIAAELRRVTASIGVDLQRAVELEQQLTDRLARLKVENGTLEGERVQLRELEREAQARRAVYEAFLLRAGETGEQRNMNSANVSLISRAHAPLLPGGTRRAYIAIGGMVLGFLFGVGLGALSGAMASLRQSMSAQRTGDSIASGGEPDPAGNGGSGPQPPDPGGRAPPPQAETLPQRPPRRDAGPQEETAEEIRRSLGAFRRRIEALAEPRTRRYG